jgi:carboxyl-terminal processing protease
MDFLTRRTVIAAPFVLATAPAPDTRHAQDFDELWETLRDHYAFIAEKSVDWPAVRRRFRPQAVMAQDDDGFARIVAAVLVTLYDPHTHLYDPPRGVPRYPPFDLDVAPHPSGALVRAVADQSAASLVGIAAGDVITAVGGEAIDAVAQRLHPACQRRADPEAWRHALGQAVAGVRGDDERLLSTQRQGPVRLRWPAIEPPEPVQSRQQADIGIIAIRSFGHPDAVSRFDAALAALSGSNGLIIDVRGNGGGDTAIARPIMARFVAQRRAYARMRRRSGAGLGPYWTEFVDPRGPLCTLPVVVLVDRWSASMAEGFAMGMKALCGARIVGQPMMGLGAAVFPLRLNRTGIGLQYSAEPVYDVQSQRRDRLRPDMLVADGVDGLPTALKLLQDQRRSA